MRLSPYVLDLYFGSDDGARLVQGFEELVALWTKHDARRAGPVDELSPVVMADAGSASEAPKDEPGSESNDDDDGLSLALEARFLIAKCFNGVTECMRRALVELGSERPTSREEAAALFDRLLEHGLVVLGRDLDAALAFDAWLEDELTHEDSDGDADDEEDSFALDDLPGDSGDAPDDDTDDEGDRYDAEDRDEELVRLGGADDHGRKLWLANIPAISWALHCFAPEWFVPYAFVHRFHQFEAICEEIGIPLARLPGKAKYLERCRHYLHMNEALNEFRLAQRTEPVMSPAELCAFLYGFCIEQVPEDEVEELPPPRRAWFLMASPEDDFEWLDESGRDSRSHWQGCNEVRPGDLCVMWCRSPRSYVHSIWRATSRGFADPFFFYYRTIHIGHPIKVPPVTFRELQADPVWAIKPATRAHFQNSSGKEVSFEEYEALLRLLEAKGFDTNSLPRLVRGPTFTAEGLETERDVEEKLLEPLLERLGYSRSDWIRQLPLRMGRGERFYPDYAFGVTGGRGEECARMIAEAKLRIATEAQLRDAYLQARSYAERLRAEVFVLCAIEGLWVYARARGRFDPGGYEHHDWEALARPDLFAGIESVMGKAFLPKLRS